MTGPTRTRRPSLLNRQAPSGSPAARKVARNTAAASTNRADSIRSRREQRARKLTNPVFGRAAGSEEPPVLVRGVSSAFPTRERKSRAPRRHYDVALNVPGAEIRLPALPTIRVGWRLASGVIVLAMIGLLVLIGFSDKFNVSTVEVTGLKRLTSKEVNLVLGVSGASIFTVSDTQIRHRLVTAYPELKDIRVKIGLPAKVVVAAVERQPVLVWEQDNAVQWVDADGYAFPPRGQVDGLITVESNEAPQLRIGEVLTTTNRILDPETVATILAMSEQTPEGISLVFDNEHGLGWDDPQGWFVYFGMNLDDMQTKLKIYEALVEHLVDEGVEPELISVEFVHAPYYRMEH